MDNTNNSRLMQMYMEKKASEQPVLTEEDQVILKYAEAADHLLQKEAAAGTLPNPNYTRDDVIEVASMLINQDLEMQKQAEAYEFEKQAELDKIAELEAAGTIIADSFVATLQNKYGFNI